MHVVVLFPGALGDLLLAAPALATLRARHPAARVTLAVSGWLRALAATSGIAHETVSLDEADASGLFGGSRLPSWFADRPVVYSWIGTRDADVRARLVSLTMRAEFFAVVRGDGPDHAASAYAGQVGTGGIGDFRWPSPSSTPRIESTLSALRRPVLALHAGTGSSAKRWAAGGFAEIARRWHRAGGDVIELVGPAERTLAPLPQALRVAEWPLDQVAALLARIDAYVGNDSGITHLAAAMGARGVAVFGPTDPRRWAPAGDVIVPLSSAAFDATGIPLDAVCAERVWVALAARGCLDKISGRA